jgi:hypothetical protein
MTGKKKNNKDAEWKEARKRCSMNTETVKMAKKLGPDPKNLIKNIPNTRIVWEVLSCHCSNTVS